MSGSDQPANPGAETEGGAGDGAPRGTAVTPMPSETISASPGASQMAFESTFPLGAGYFRGAPPDTGRMTRLFGAF